MTRKRLIQLCAGASALAVLAIALCVPRLARAAPAVFIEVGDGSDTFPCAPGVWTLRCAINYANLHPGTSIRFAFSAQTVQLQSALPTITGASTFINGLNFQDQYVGPTIDGSAMSSGVNGLTINANIVTIENIKVVNIPAGADISIVGGKDIEISYDYLGILPGATQCGGSQSTVGIGVAGDTAGIGGNNAGTAYIHANTISCHGGSGVEVVNSNYVYVGTQRNGVLSGNNVGTTPDGTRAAGNGYAGVRVSNSDSVTIISNTIAYNANGGVTLNGTNMIVNYNTLSANYWGLAIGGGSTQQIVGNKIGTSADGLLPLPNAHEGIFISGGSGLFIDSNTVAYNGAAGIAVIGNSTHALMQTNDIYRNGGLPIDLGDDGATPNGTKFPPGPNNWLAYPVVTAFSGSIVLGTACANCHVFIFKATGNPAAPGGGGLYQTDALVNPSGQWSVNLPNGLTRLDVTFTATDAGYNTSEMSPRPLVVLPLIMR